MVAGGGHLLAPFLLCISLAAFKQQPSKKDVSLVFWLLITLLALVGLGGECYLVAVPTGFYGDAQEIDAGLGVLSWACFFAGAAWGWSKGMSAKYGILLWCAVELVCCSPLSILILYNSMSPPGLSLAAVASTLATKALIMCFAIALSERSGVAWDPEEGWMEDCGGVSEENLHELSNPLSQMLL